MRTIAASLSWSRVSNSGTICNTFARNSTAHVYMTFFAALQTQSIGPMFWTFDGFDECDALREGIKLLAEVL